MCVYVCVCNDYQMKIGRSLVNSLKITAPGQNRKSSLVTCFQLLEARARARPPASPVHTFFILPILSSMFHFPHLPGQLVVDYYLDKVNDIV